MSARTPPSTHAGGQDDGSYTNSLKLLYLYIVIYKGVGLMLNPPLLLRRPDVQTSSKKEPPLQEDPGRFGRLWRMSHTFRIFLGIAALRGHCHHIVQKRNPPPEIFFLGSRVARSGTYIHQWWRRCVARILLRDQLPPYWIVVLGLPPGSAHGYPHVLPHG